MGLSMTAYEITWPVSPAAVTPNRSPLSSVDGGGGGLEPGERSPDRSSSRGAVTPVDCPPSGIAGAHLSAASCLRGAVSTTEDSLLLAGVQCRLETKDLWDKFYELGTEMIITKSGRSPAIIFIHQQLVDRLNEILTTTTKEKV